MTFLVCVKNPRMSRVCQIRCERINMQKSQQHACQGSTAMHLKVCELYIWLKAKTSTLISPTCAQASSTSKRNDPASWSQIKDKSCQPVGKYVLMVYRRAICNASTHTPCVLTPRRPNFVRQCKDRAPPFDVGKSPRPFTFPFGPLSLAPLVGITTRRCAGNASDRTRLLSRSSCRRRRLGR